MPERDPRSDPRPGDVLEHFHALCGRYRYLNGERVASGQIRGRSVVCIDGFSVKYEPYSDAKRDGSSRRCDIARWRTWARYATVIRRAE